MRRLLCLITDYAHSYSPMKKKTAKTESGIRTNKLVIRREAISTLVTAGQQGAPTLDNTNVHSDCCQNTKVVSGCV